MSYLHAPHTEQRWVLASRLWCETLTAIETGILRTGCSDGHKARIIRACQNLRGIPGTAISVMTPDRRAAEAISEIGGSLADTLAMYHPSRRIVDPIERAVALLSLTEQVAFRGDHEGCLAACYAADPETAPRHNWPIERLMADEQGQSDV